MDRWVWVEVVAVAIGVAMSLGGAVAFVWAVGKVKGLDVTIDLLKSGNEGLRQEIGDSDRRHAAELARLEQQLAAERRACDERIARLEGQNAALLDGLADKIAKAIAGQLERLITDVARSTPGGTR